MILTRFRVVAMLLVLSAPLALAQNKLDGTWKAALAVGGQRCTVSQVIGPGQRYNEVVRCGAMMTSQSGTYTLANDVLTRTVTDFEPKRRYVLDSGYSGHWEQNAPPPGGTYRIKFSNPDTMVWQDVNFGGTITFRRSK